MENITKTPTGWAQHSLELNPQTIIRYAIYSSQPLTQDDHWILFINGRSEWIEKYAHLPNSLGLSEAYPWLTLDHLGQGASTGQRGHIQCYSEYIKSLSQLIQHLGIKSYDIIAHSMGGLISLSSTLQKKLQPRRLALASPLLGFQDISLPKWIVHPLVRGLACSPLARCPSGITTQGEKTFETNPYTHDLQRYEAMRQTPYPVGSPTFGWIAASQNEIDKVQDELMISQLTCPTLLLYGLKERVVNPNCIEKWHTKAQQHAKADIQLYAIKDGLHELLCENHEIFTKTADHIKQFLAPLPEKTH